VLWLTATARVIKSFYLGALAGLFGASWLFIAPSKRYVGSDPSERIHGSVPVGSVGVLADFHYDAGG
jgi:hypothetical protein